MDDSCCDKLCLAKFDCAVCGVNIDGKNGTHFLLNSAVGQFVVDMILQYCSVHITSGAICHQCDRILSSIHGLITDLKMKVSRNYKSVPAPLALSSGQKSANCGVLEPGVVPEQMELLSVKLERASEEDENFDENGEIAVYERSDGSLLPAPPSRCKDQSTGLQDDEANHSGPKQTNVDINRSTVGQLEAPACPRDVSNFSLSTEPPGDLVMNVIRFHNSERQQVSDKYSPTHVKSAAAANDLLQMNEGEHGVTQHEGHLRVSDKEVHTLNTLETPVSVLEEKHKVIDLVRGQAVDGVNLRTRVQSKRPYGEGKMCSVFHHDRKPVDSAAPDDFIEHDYAKRNAGGRVAKIKVTKLNKAKRKQNFMVDQRGSSSASQRSASTSQGSASTSQGSASTSRFILLPPGTVLPNMTVNPGQIILTSAQPSVAGVSTPLTPMVFTPARASRSVENGSPAVGRTPVKIMPKPGLFLNRLEVKKEEMAFKCDECDRGFRSSVSLKAHKRIVHGKKISCEMCPQTFFYECHKMAHMVYHQDTTTCVVCGETFSTFKQLYQHTSKKHRSLKKYKCRECGLPCRTQMILEEHESTHTGTKSFCCDQCGRQFRRYQHFQMHYRQHTGYRPFVCDTCGQRYVSASALKAHKRYHVPETERRYKCSKCGRGFVKNDSRTIHQAKCGLRNSYKCAVCGVSFVKRAKCISHQASCSASEKPYPCSVCGCRFVDQVSCRSHESSCTQKESLMLNQKTKCTKCKVLCATDKERAEHVCGSNVKRLEHVKTRTFVYKCMKCGERFKCALDRCKHLNTSHATPGEEPHSCKVCVPELRCTSAVSSQSLKTYKCKICSVHFDLINQLSDHVEQSHMTSSSKLKNPAVCEVCGTMFMQRENYLVHRANKHGEHTGEQHQCDICNRWFARKACLAEHRQSHFNQEIPCPVCDSTFKSVKAMKRHYHTSHKGLSVTSSPNVGMNEHVTTRQSDEIPGESDCGGQNVSSQYCKVSSSLDVM